VINTPSGGKKWYQNGKLHRIDGPAIEEGWGTKEWYQNGKLHRIDGPAIEKPWGTRLWYKNGELHRIDGPAIEFNDITIGWYIGGKEYSEDEFNKLMELRRRDLARWVYEQWYSGFMRNPHTERGRKYISKDYDRMIKELEQL
jgi:hypothetical protein